MIIYRVIVKEFFESMKALLISYMAILVKQQKNFADFILSNNFLYVVSCATTRN